MPRRKKARRKGGHCRHYYQTSCWMNFDKRVWRNAGIALCDMPTTATCYVKSRRGQRERVRASLGRYVERKLRLKLTVNEEKECS